MPDGRLGKPTVTRGSHFAIDEPGDSSRCGQPGVANQVATTKISGVNVEVLVQCAAWPKCTLKDGETNGEFLLFVPEHVSKHYAIQLDSGHIPLAHFLEIAKSFTRVGTSGQSSQKTWINESGCAAPGDGLVWAQQPGSIGVTCDPHDQIVDARWRNWGQDTAQATATLAVDNCQPDCGGGRVAALRDHHDRIEDRSLRYAPGVRKRDLLRDGCGPPAEVSRPRRGLLLGARRSRDNDDHDQEVPPLLANEFPERGRRIGP